MLLFKIDADGYSDIVTCCETNMKAKQAKMNDFKFRCSCGPTRMRASGFGGGVTEAKRRAGGGGVGSDSSSSSSSSSSATDINYSTETVVAVEVKSKNDTLSEYQELWMQLLKASSIRAEILKVTD